MEFAQVLSQRHSVRDFRSDPVSRDTLDRIMRAAAMAPSAANEQPWHFFVCQGESRSRIMGIMPQSTTYLAEYLDALVDEDRDSAIRWFSSLGDAPVIVGVGMQASDDDFLRLNRLIGVGAAIENLLLSVTDEGLAACNITFSFWVRDQLGEAMRLPEGYEIVSLIAVGYPSDTPPVAPKHDLNVATYLE